MKVIYQRPIKLRIQAAVYEADAAGKRIERIDVTVDEANELSDDIRRSLWAQEDPASFRHYTVADAGAVVGYYYAAKICVEKS